MAAATSEYGKYFLNCVFNYFISIIIFVYLFYLLFSHQFYFYFIFASLIRKVQQIITLNAKIPKLKKIFLKNDL